jgi:hypothetical protein
VTILSSQAHAGSAVRIGWSCSDILNYSYNYDRFAIGNGTVSLRSCSGQSITLLDQSNQRCVAVNLCEQSAPAPAPAPAPRRTEERGHDYCSNESIGGYYSDGTYDGRAHHYESDRYNNSNNGGA